MSNKKKAQQTSRNTGSSAAPSRRQMLREQQEAAEARRRRTMRAIIIGAVILGLALAGVVGSQLYKKYQDDKAVAARQITPPNANAERSGIVLNPGRAKAGAPTVALYLDYQCPNCKALENTYGAMFESLADKGEISLEYRTMTFMDIKLSNTASKRAAQAAACANQAGVYAKYHDEIFTHQAAQEIKGSEGYSDDILRSTIPQSVGLSGEKLTKFQTCYDDRATQKFVQDSDERAAKAGIGGTPNITVNGNKLDLQETDLGKNETELLAALKSKA